MYNCHMPKSCSDLPSQGAALRAAVERQQRDLRNTAQVVDTNSIARDFERMRRIAGASSVVRDVRRICLTLSESNVVKDYRRVAEALQAQQKRALHTQRLLSRSPVLEALERIKRVTEIQHRQWKSIARAASGSTFASTIRPMDLAFSGSAFAKDLGRITDAARFMQARTDAARRALSASLDFSPLEHLPASFLRGLHQSLTVAAATTSVARPQDAPQAPQAPSATSNSNTATAGPPNAIGAVSEEAHYEWRIEVFLAKLPAYFEPRDKLPPKLRLH